LRLLSLLFLYVVMLKISLCANKIIQFKSRIHIIRRLKAKDRGNAMSPALFFHDCPNLAAHRTSKLLFLLVDPQCLSFHLLETCHHANRVPDLMTWLFLNPSLNSIVCFFPFVPPIDFFLEILVAV
jgi:hypothetical protein